MNICFSIEYYRHLKEKTNLVNRFQNVRLRIFKSFNHMLLLLHFEIVFNLIDVINVGKFASCFPLGEALIFDGWRKWLWLLDIVFEYFWELFKRISTKWFLQQIMFHKTLPWSCLFEIVPSKYSARVELTRWSVKTFSKKKPKPTMKIGENLIVDGPKIFATFSYFLAIQFFFLEVSN